MLKRTFWIAIILLILAGVGSGVFSVPKKEQAADKSIINEKQASVTVALVGDIMLDRGVERSVENNFNGDYGALFANIPELAEADLAFGNLEGPIAASGRNVGSKYSFRMSPAVLPALKGAGFDVLSFANNHAGDWSREAFLETLSLLERAGIATAGAGNNALEAAAPRVLTVHGRRIGFLAFSDVGPGWLEATTSAPGITLAREKELVRQVASARQQVDVLIVSFHWGDEYKPYNTQQKKLAERAIDAGADVIVGHHPHVMQATTVYKSKPIFYSLGNFIFDQAFSPETMRGMVVLLTISPEGVILYEEKVTDLSKAFQPQPLRPIKESDRVLVEKKETVTAVPAPKSVPAKPFSCPKPKQQPADYFLLSLPNESVNLASYIPANLVHVPNEVTGIKNICITKETYAAYKVMRAAMRKDGVDAHILSGWRDAETQAENFEEKGGKIAAAVGQSEHHLGTAVDFTSGTVPVKFAESPEFPWMQEHAWEYGFVQSYQPDHTGETGFMGEAWHWRYVGKAHAKKLHREPVALNAYLANL